MQHTRIDNIITTTLDHGDLAEAVLIWRPKARIDGCHLFSVLGRWDSQDPARYVNGVDLYQLEESRPTSVLDPSGLRCLSFNDCSELCRKVYAKFLHDNPGLTDAEKQVANNINQNCIMCCSKKPDSGCAANLDFRPQKPMGKGPPRKK